jgi:3-hydroxypropanoate dehydrogenase
MTRHVSASIGALALDQLFVRARTFDEFLPTPVEPALLRIIYDVAKWGPTSANSQPARFVFLVSPEAKARLQPALDAGNRAKSLRAPVTLIVAYDLRFYEHLPKLYPHADARTWFEGKPELSVETAFRNAALQGAYYMLAARAVGLDCGPMSGFDEHLVNREFFPDERCAVHFLCNLGYGDRARLRPRGPRLEFSQTCRVL